MARNFRHGVITLGILTIAGCSLYQPPIDRLQAMHSIHGKQVQVGFFNYSSLQGDYVLLARSAQRWKIQSISAAPVKVPDGDELLFVEERGNSWAVTPAYPLTSEIDSSDMLWACDNPPRGYGPCKSALVMNTLPPLKRAGVDRSAVTGALVQASVLEALEVAHSATAAREQSEAHANAICRGVRSVRTKSRYSSSLLVPVTFMTCHCRSAFTTAVSAIRIL